jgi:UDP-N-acetylglucosamine 2-epimerase (non-hydrolysing)
MIDTLLANREKAKKSNILKQLGLCKRKYGVITLHRPSNVDDTKKFQAILLALNEIQKELKLVFPIHPRTRKNITSMNMEKLIDGMENLLLIQPAGYLDFLCLLSDAALVITDSGGIQEETTILGVPCMTLRENTERPVTIAEGTNHLVHVTSEDILKNYREIKDGDKNINRGIPKLWDGKAAQRIARIIAQSKPA